MQGPPTPRSWPITRLQPVLKPGRGRNEQVCTGEAALARVEGTCTRISIHMNEALCVSTLCLCEWSFAPQVLSTHKWIVSCMKLHLCEWGAPTCVPLAQVELHARMHQPFTCPPPHRAGPPSWKAWGPLS